MGLWPLHPVNMSNIIQLPDILEIVMDWLRYDTLTLRTALLVNKVWFAEAIRVLWKKPPVAALSALSSISYDRRQFYADHVRELSFDGTNEGSENSKFYDVHFRRLRCIRVKGNCFCHIPRDKENLSLYIGQYLQPNLEEFVLSDVDTELAEDIFHLLETRCPGLRTLRMRWFSTGFPSTRLLKFLHTCKSLKVIHLVVYPGGAKEHIDYRLLACLAHYYGLRQL